MREELKILLVIIIFIATFIYSNKHQFKQLNGWMERVLGKETILKFNGNEKNGEYSMINTFIKPWNTIKIKKSKVFIYCRVWDNFLDCFVFELVRWQRITHYIKTFTIQVLKLVRMGYWAGFCSQGRGLTWDRKSRYGEK